MRAASFNGISPAITVGCNIIFQREHIRRFLRYKGRVEGVE